MHSDMKKRIKYISAVAAALLLAAAISVSSFANWYDDVGGGTYKEIKGKGFVADTFCGVDALYNENDSYYQCNELIMRFYREAFGLEVLAYANTGLVMLTEGYAFEPTSEPKKGDVVYCTAAMRGSSSDHWAIVKDYSDGKLTLFEQNVVWEGKAGVGRRLKYPSDSYYLYTPVGLGGNADPVPRGVSQTVTEKPTTAAPTTAKATTSKPTTVKQTTAKATVKDSDAETTVLSTAAATTVTTTLSETTTEFTCVPSTIAVPATHASTAPITSAEAKDASDGYAAKLLPLCAGLAAVMVMVILIIKNKRK